MARMLYAALVVGIFIQSRTAEAAPHLGMKLACKRYGEAWNTGARGPLYGQVTGDFAGVFRRVPDHMFASMPRGGSGKVLSSSKGNGVGHVTVATPHGVVTFVLVGSGFQWTVSDIYRKGDDGRTVSLKNYLAASVTAHEFITDFRSRGGDTFHDSITARFRQSFRELSSEELDIVRSQLPPISRQVKPHLSMSGRVAVMTVHLPNSRVARLSLVNEGSWKVDDYGVESPTMSIASFRNSLDTVVAITRFRQFMVNPGDVDPVGFTMEGQLRDSLTRVREIGHLPLNQKPSNLKHCSIDASGRNVLIKLEDSRQVRLLVDRGGAGARIQKVDVTLGKQWADLGHLIALNDRARRGLGLVGIAKPAAAVPVAAVVSAPEAASASVLTPASAQIIESAPKPATGGATAQRIATKTVESPAIRKVSYSSNVSPVKIQRGRKVGLFGRMRGRR